MRGVVRVIPIYHFVSDFFVNQINLPASDRYVRLQAKLVELCLAFLRRVK